MSFRAKQCNLIIFLILFIVFLVFPVSVSAQQSSIRVSGFTSPRNRYPLIGSDGNPPQWYDKTGNIYSQLIDANNFGSEGITKCIVDLHGAPFTNYINSGFLVDESGNLVVDIFFGGMNEDDLSLEEAQELSDFINAGGVVYMAGDVNNAGPAYNPFFTNQGLSDHYSSELIYTGYPVFSSDPPDTTAVTNGPFGTVGSLRHSPYRAFKTSSMISLATGFDSQETILAETIIGKGYLSVSGDSLYTDYFAGYSENSKYFLNLFALGCRDKPEKLLNVPSYKQGLSPFDGEDPTWENEEYDHANQQSLNCGTSIAQCGCALTSVDMVMNYYGIETGLNANFDPDINNVKNLNDYFVHDTHYSGNNIYSFGYFNGLVRWAEPSIFSQVLQATIAPNQSKLDIPIIENFDSAKLKSYLDQGIPVIQKVSGSFGTHWVVVTGYDGNEFIINDPASPDPQFGQYTKLSDNYTPQQNNSMVHYITTNSDYRYIEIVSEDEFTLTDQSNNTNENIPNTTYFTYDPYGDPTGQSQNSSQPTLYSLLIKLPESQNFTLETNSTENSSITIYAANSEGEQSTQSHNLNPETQNSLNFDSQTGETTVEEIVNDQEIQIDIMPWRKRNWIWHRRRRPILVAILGSDDFNPKKEIKKSTITFGKTGDEDSLRRCFRRKYDVNRDGHKDMLCLFSAKKSNFKKGDTVAHFKAQTKDGINLFASDRINVI